MAMFNSSFLRFYIFNPAVYKVAQLGQFFEQLFDFWNTVKLGSYPFQTCKKKHQKCPT